MEMLVDARANGVTVIQPVGRIDLMSAPDVRRRLQQAAVETKARIVVDLDRVTFVDSSGLGALVGGLKAARLAGGDLRIARAGEQVLVILRLTNLDKVLTPFGSLEEAVAAP